MRNGGLRQEKERSFHSRFKINSIPKM